MKKLFILCILLLVTFLGQSQTLRSNIEFVVNTDSIIENESFDNFKRMLPYVLEHSMEVNYVLITGSSSPEGNSRRNNELATQRANKVQSFLKDAIPQERIITQVVESPETDAKNYPKLRSASIEINISPKDTVYHKTIVETVKIDSIIMVPQKEEHTLVFSLYNNILSDLLLVPNIGIDFRIKQFSLFIDASYSKSPVFGKSSQLISWNTGFRTYGNKENKGLFIEAYAQGGYFDFEMVQDYGIFYGCGVGIGYKIDLLGPWKIYPEVRFGVDKLKYNEYYPSSGKINITFGKYTDGIENQKEESLINKGINKEFFDDCIQKHYFGPTFIGLTIQRDFYLKK